MNMYRGCMMTIFISFIALVSLLFGAVLGLVGLLLPLLLVGFAYLLVNSIIVELMWWDRDRNR